MLYRALGHLERGFYIDIGAQHPEIDSVSKAFFDRGWQGVHVEPVPHYANLLREARPGDRVIEAAVCRPAVAGWPVCERPAAEPRRCWKA